MGRTRCRRARPEPSNFAAVLVVNLRRHAETRGLDLAAIHRKPGLPGQKQERMSVPPEIDASCTSRLIRRYT